MNPENNQHPFISYLEEHREDRAMLAALRRGIGQQPGEVTGMFPYVVPFIHDRYEEANIYLIASLFAMHPASATSGNMGSHLLSYVNAVGDDTATARRFTQLMRQHRDALDAPLRQHISMLKAKDIPINWHRLMRDLKGWDHESHYVQREWAKAFWNTGKNQTNQ